MKGFVQFLTVYMFVLFLVPCGDGGGGIVELANHLFGLEHQHVADHTQHSKSCGDDHCPPFCICTCCSTVVDISIHDPLSIKSPALPPKTTPFFTPNFLSFSFDIAIWEPPRLA